MTPRKSLIASAPSLPSTSSRLTIFFRGDLNFLARRLRSVTGGARGGLRVWSKTAGGGREAVGSSRWYDAAAEGVSAPGGVSLTRLFFFGVLSDEAIFASSDEGCDGEEERHDLRGVAAGESVR